MNEWLLIVMMLTGNGPVLTIVRLPTQQSCMDAGVETMRLRGMMSGWAKYSCTEITPTRVAR